MKVRRDTSGPSRSKESGLRNFEIRALVPGAIAIAQDALTLRNRSSSKVLIKRCTLEPRHVEADQTKRLTGATVEPWRAPEWSHEKTRQMGARLHRHGRR